MDGALGFVMSTNEIAFDMVMSAYSLPLGEVYPQQSAPVLAPVPKLFSGNQDMSSTPSEAKPSAF